MLIELHRMMRGLTLGESIIMTTQAEAQAAIDASIAATTAQTSVVESVVTALNGTNQRIADAIAAFEAANPTVNVDALKAATDAELANTKALADAVIANTPHAPPAPAPDAPPADPTSAPTT